MTKTPAEIFSKIREHVSVLTKMNVLFKAPDADDAIITEFDNSVDELLDLFNELEHSGIAAEFQSFLDASVAGRI